MFVPDKLQAFKEVHRVLKKVGKFVFSTWDKIETVETFAIANKIIQDFFNDNAPSFFKIPYSMYDTKELQQLLANSGFLNVQIELVKKRGHADTALDAAKGIIEGNPIYKEIIDYDPNAVNILEEKIALKFEEEFGKSALSPSMQALVGSGVK